MNTPNHARLWTLDPRAVFLNHGSFGATPRAVLTLQSQLRARMEAQPVRFMVHELEGLLDHARAAIGAFVGAHPDDLALVPNATCGVNTVLRSLAWERSDEILVTQHGYNACTNAARYIAEQFGAKVVVARVPFPIEHSDEVTQAVLAAVTARTRLALVDHVTSPTGLVFPVEAIVRALDARGIDTLVDGAHAPGMLPLALDALGAAYYTGNLHKWVCAPKGAAFLHVRRDRQPAVRPLAISHGANATRTDRSRFRLEFDWTGTLDPTAWLCVPEALRVVGALSPDGWAGVMRDNRALCLEARTIVADSLGVAAPAPDAMLGSLGAVLFHCETRVAPGQIEHPIQTRLRQRHEIEVPVFAWGEEGGTIVRVSAQRYNHPAHYALLASALRECIVG